MTLPPTNTEPLTDEERRLAQVASFMGECRASNLLGWQASKDDRQRSAARYMSHARCAACRFRAACCQRLDDVDERVRIRNQIGQVLGEDFE